MRRTYLKRGIMALTVFALVGAMSLGNAETSNADPRGRMFPDHNRLAMMRGLDLSDSQKEQIREIYRALRENKREKVRAAMDFEGDIAEKDLAEIKTEISEMIYKGMEAQYQVFQVLTLEQRTTLEEKIKGNHENRKDITENRRNRFNEKLTRELDLTSNQQAKLRKMKFDRDDRDGMHFLEEKLDLTYSQKEKITSILEKHRDDNRGLEISRQRFRDLRDLAAASTFDEAKAKKLASDMADEMVSRIRERNAMNAEIMKVLNEDQKEEFKEIREHFEGRQPFGAPFHGAPHRI